MVRPGEGEEAGTVHVPCPVPASFPPPGRTSNPLTEVPGPFTGVPSSCPFAPQSPHLLISPSPQNPLIPHLPRIPSSPRNPPEPGRRPEQQVRAAEDVVR